MIAKGVALAAKSTNAKAVVVMVRLSVYRLFSIASLDIHCCLRDSHGTTTLCNAGGAPKPNDAPAAKQSAVRGYGAEVILCEATMEARDAASKRYMEESGDACYFIHSANNVDVMSGQATAVVELLEQVEQEHGVALDAIVVPISGGGLCSGAAVAAKVGVHAHSLAPSMQWRVLREVPT